MITISDHNKTIEPEICLMKKKVRMWKQNHKVNTLKKKHKIVGTSEMPKEKMESF